MKNVLVDEFDSRADLIDAVVCSCFIPGFSAYEVPTYKVHLPALDWAVQGDSSNRFPYSVDC